MKRFKKFRRQAEDNKKRRGIVHSFTIAVFLYRNAFLLLIPILQYLLFKPQNLWELFRQGDLLLAAAVILYAVLRYRCADISLENKKIIERRGVFFRRKRIVFKRRLCGLAVKSGPVSSIFRAAVFCIDTGTRKLAVEEYVSKRYAARIYSSDGRIKRFGVFDSIVAAADATSALSGLLLVIPFLRKTAPLLGENLSAGFYGGVGIWSQILSQLLPPAAAYVSAFIAAGYLAAFLYELLRHVNMSLKLGGEALEINRGFLLRLRLVLPVNEISAVTYEQGLLCFVFGIKKVFLLSHTGERLGSERELAAVRRGVVRAPKDAECVLKPGKLGIFSFSALPFSLFALSVLSSFYLQAAGELAAVSIVLSVAVPFFMFWTFFRALAYERTFLSKQDGKVLLGFYSGYRFVRAEAELEKIDIIKIRRSLFQRLFGSCTVMVYVRNRRRPFAIRKLKYDKEALNRFLNADCF